MSIIHPFPLLPGALYFDLLRPDDLLVLTVELVNFRLDKTNAKKPLLKVDKAANPAYLIAHFQPQSITEQAFFETSAIPPQPYNVPPPPAEAPPADPSTSDTLVPPGQVPARMSAPSRLVFRVPANAKPIPFTVEGLLDWSPFSLVVSATAGAASDAKPSAALKIAAPTPLETALEIPYRLILSPNSDVGWLHALMPVTHAGRTELWHTRMGRMVTQGKTKVPLDPTALNAIPLRAIWTPDFVGNAALPSFFSNNPPNYLTPMTPRDRNEIVILTSGFYGYFAEKLNSAGATVRVAYVPLPVQASRVFLTALGGWLSSRGRWDPLANYTYGPTTIAAAKPAAVKTGSVPAKASTQPAANAKATVPSPSPSQLRPEVFIPPVQSLELSEWDHIATMGRDHYVKIVYEGYLYPFGHRAALIKVSERKFFGGDVAPINDPVAYLTQHMYIVVREPVKSYVASPYTYKGRENPFRSQVEIKTVVTPEIDQPAMSQVTGSSDSFWVQVKAQDLPWHVAATDLAGVLADFHGAMIFIPVSETNLSAVTSQYVSQQSGERRAFQMHARNVTYADPTQGDTALKTTTLYFDTQVTKPKGPWAEVPFVPRLDANTAAEVTMPALEALTGGSPDVKIHLFQQYLAQGMDGNAGVFAEVNVAPAVAFSANKAGGFARPNLSVSAVTARKGLTGGSSTDAAKGLIDPAAFFGNVDAKLFGTVPLKDLIPIGSDLKALAAKNAPEIRTHSSPNAIDPQTITTKVSWEPDLVPGWPNSSGSGSGSGPLQVQFNSNGNKSSLTLHATFVRYFNGKAPTSQIHGAMSNFLVTLFGVMGVQIDSITFDSTNGSKTMVAAHLPNNAAIQFLGALQFVQKLAEVIPPGVFGGAGPSIVLASSYLRVSYTLGLPPISVGVLSLENIAITVALDLPYLDGKPEFEFAFASRSNPFLITVDCLGGGGFVHLIISADGVQMVEGSLEFGGEFSIDLGVASGGVHIMAGIYFQLTNTSTTLTGFVDIGGEVSVLGIISISIDLNLSLSFIHNQYGNKVQGRATLSISVHIIFFSISVSVSVERSFGDHGGDPRMKQLIGPADWAAYAGAIA
jgi:hypothetical protein